MDATDNDDESIVGDECHIISGKPNGPRNDPEFPLTKLDSYSNLLLLCRVHHKQVDDQATTFTADMLRQVKANHERWVSQKLSGNDSELGPVRVSRVRQNIPQYLVRLTTGRELLNIVDGAYALAHNTDEPENINEVDLVSYFLQLVSDYIDLGIELEPGERLRLGFELSQLLKELEHVGFLVFGGREIRILEGGVGPPDDFPVAIIGIHRNTNELIRTFGKEDHTNDSI